MITLESLRTGRSSQTYPAFSISTETPGNFCTIYQLHYDKPSVSRPTFVDFRVLCLVSQLSSNFCLKYVLNEWKVFDKFPNMKKKKGKKQRKFFWNGSSGKLWKTSNDFHCWHNLVVHWLTLRSRCLWALRNSPNDQVLVHTVTLSWYY